MHILSLAPLPVTLRRARNIHTLVSKFPHFSVFAPHSVHLRIGRRLAVRFRSTIPLDMEKVDTASRLTELRKLMSERKVDVYSKLANISNALSDDESSGN